MSNVRAELVASHHLEEGQPLCVEFVDVADFPYLQDDLDYRFMKFAFCCAAQAVKGISIQVMNFGLNADEENHFRQILYIQGKLPRGPESTATMPT